MNMTILVLSFLLFSSLGFYYIIIRIINLPGYAECILHILMGILTICNIVTATKDDFWLGFVIAVYEMSVINSLIAIILLIKIPELKNYIRSFF
jgi:energy-converting hydrogenase Eha subunit B